MRRLALAGCAAAGVFAAAAAGVVSAAALTASASGAGPSDPVGRWHLDEIQGNTTPDSSGNGLDGTVSQLVSAMSGRFGNAVSLTAPSRGSSAIVVTGSKSLEPKELTVLAWVKRSGAPPTYRYVIAKGARACQAASYALYTGGTGGLAFYVDDGSQARLSPDAGPGLWDGDWHAVAGRYDGSRVRLFVDGREIGDGTPFSGDISYSGADPSTLVFGTYPATSCGDYGWSGALDEVQIYPRALSVEEIRQLQSADGPSPPQLGPTTTAATSSTTSSTSATTSPPTTPQPTTSQATVPAPPAPKSRAYFSVKKGSSAGLRNAVWLSAAGSYVRAGTAVTSYDWRLNNFLEWKCRGGSPAISIAFARPGQYLLRLRISDAHGGQAVKSFAVSVAASEVSSAKGPVFDCENPGAGNQPSTAGCMKSFGFGLVDVNSRGGAEDCFRLTAIPSGKFITAQDGRKFPLSYFRATIKGPVAVNGLYVPVPSSVETQYDQQTDSLGLGKRELRFGKYGTPPVDLNLKVIKNSFGYYHVRDVSLAGALPKIGGLSIEPTASLDFFPGKTRITLNAAIPKVFTFGDGNAAAGGLVLYADNERGLVLDGGKLGPIDAFLGPVFVKGLMFEYRGSNDSWSGAAQVSLPGSLIGIGGDFGIVHGAFDHARVKVTFPVGAQPQVFPGLFLTQINAGFGRNPIRFEGGAGISAGEVVDIDGKVFVAFASAGTPYQFPEQAGELQALSGRTLRSLSIAVGGTASLHLPILDRKLALANAYLIYEYPSFVELAGGISFQYSFLSVEGGVHGFADGSSRTWNLDGGVKGCLRNIAIGPVDLDFVCATVGGVVSSKGIAFCGTVPVPFFGGVVPVPIGAGYAWGDSAPTPMVFSCDYGPWKESIPAGFAYRTGTGASPRAVTIGAGLPGAMIRVTGKGAPPDVVVAGPGGQTVSTAAPPRNKSVLALKLKDTNTTYVAFKNPAAGRWTVTPTATSAPVLRVSVAGSLRAAKITTRVRGTGSRRTLEYTATAAPGRAVTFAERGPQTYRILGKARGRSGRIAFSPAPGPAGVRQIVAQLSQNGQPGRTLVVGRFQATSAPRLTAPREIRITPAKNALLVTWKKVPGATRYTITVVPAKGRRAMTVVPGSRALVRVRPGERGVLLVSAVGPDGSRSRPTRARFTTPRPR